MGRHGECLWGGFRENSLRGDPPMNKIFFGLKRAYHGTLRLTRQALATLGLTAARFDLLYVLDKARGEMPQRELQRALGVAASTVSRMLASLEELDLVTREIMLDDHRRTWVELTREGRRRVREAVRSLIETGNIQLALDSALSPDRWHDVVSCALAQGACDVALRRVRHAYGDVATLGYPLVPDYVPPDDDRIWEKFWARATP